MSLSHRSTKRSLRRSFAVTAAGAMIAALLPFGVASAQEDTGVDDPQVPQEDVCPPPDATAEDVFADDEESVHEANINCVAAYDIAQGFEDGTYRPGVDVTRAQMATFIANFISRAGFDLPAASEVEDAFTDDEESVHEANINIIAELGVVVGTGGGNYDPEGDVTRAQMATFIAQAIDVVDDGQVNGSLPDEGQEDAFIDDEGSVHEDNINRLAAAGVVRGKSDTQYDPQEAVNRGQMASFIMNAASYLHDKGLWAPTQAAEVTLTATAVEQGGFVEGTITADEPIASVTVSGCGFDGVTVEDTNEDEAGIQFREQLEEDAPAAGEECTLFFEVTFEDGDTETLTARITIEEDEAPPPAPQGVTGGPELTSAEVVDRDPVLGTRVRFNFDDDITGRTPDCPDFHVYEFDRTQYDGTSCEIEDNDSVLVRFAGITAAADAENLSLATVDYDAVTDPQGNENPEGDAALTPAGTTLQAGNTVAPDLANCGNFRGTGDGSGDTLVDFTFDEAASTTGAANRFFGLVEVDGVPDDHDSNNVVSGGGTTTLTVRFDTTQALTQAEVARCYVDEGTVRDGDGNTNVLQAAEVSNNGNSVNPDLVSAEYRPDATVNNAQVDQVLYTFDEAVASGSAVAGNFFVYRSNGSQVPGTDAARSTQNTSQVLVTFPDGTLQTATGASVEEGAVLASDDNAPNQEDEVAQAGTGVGAQAGRTEAPDLIDATKEAITDPFGTVTGHRITYTFDEDVENDVEANFHAYLADMTRLTPTSCTVGTTEDTDNVVRCDYGTNAENAVLATVDNGAVDEQGTGTLTNPEGAEIL